MTPRSDKKFDVLFDDGTTNVFDRVVSRYGPAGTGSAPIAAGRSRNTQEGDWLLNADPVLLPDPDDPAEGKYVDPPRAAVANARDMLEDRVRTADGISKWRYLLRLQMGATEVDIGDRIYADPQCWLAAELAAGRYPGFDLDRKIDRALARR